MVSLFALWLPIVLSAVVMFIASSVIHMMLPYHRSDFKKMDNEGRLLETLSSMNPPAGDYQVPRYTGAGEEPGGVRALITISHGKSPMGKLFGQWFAYGIIVSAFAAYIAGRALEPGAEYLEVFRYTGTVAFVGYTLALFHDSIWYGRAWSTTIKYMFDGLVYALLTAGVFGWLWPV